GGQKVGSAGPDARDPLGRDLESQHAGSRVVVGEGGGQPHVAEADDRDVVVVAAELGRRRERGRGRFGPRSGCSRRTCVEGRHGVPPGRRCTRRRNRDGRGGVRSGGSGADGHTVVAVLGNGQRRRGRCAGAPGGGCGKPHGRAASRARGAGASAARASSVGAEPDRGGRMTASVVTRMVGVAVNPLLWVGAGLVRRAAARLGGRPRHRGGRIPRPDEVAIVIAAHNEALVIEATIRSAARQVPVENVFVACDGCTDDTVAIARACGATALDIHPNRGKAGAIRAIVEELALADRFEVLLLLDADSQLHDDYLVSGLPAFADPEVVAVAGRATTILDPPPATVLGRILV